MNASIERAGPKVGDRVRYLPYRAVWNEGRGRSGEEGTLVEILDSAAEGMVRLVVEPGSGGTTDTVFHAMRGRWPRTLEPMEESATMNAIEYEVQGWYADAHGWETVCTEESFPAAKEMKAVYDREEPQYRHRVVRVEREEVAQPKNASGFRRAGDGRGDGACAACIGTGRESGGAVCPACRGTGEAPDVAGDVAGEIADLEAGDDLTWREEG